MRIKWHGQKANQRNGNVIAKHIGQQLFKLREKRQLTMRDAAKLAGISNPFWCQIENGQSIPTAETLWKMSCGLDVPVSYWFRGLKKWDLTCTRNYCGLSRSSKTRSSKA